MTREFKQEVNNLYRELLALKSQKERMAGTLETKTQTFSLSFDLELIYEWGVAIVRSKKIAVVDLNIENHNPLISIRCNIDNLDNRAFIIKNYYNHSNGHIGYKIDLQSYNQSDYNTLSGGGSVVLNYNFTITTTASVGLSTSYEDR